MGTRTGKILLLIAIVALGLSSLAWADTAPEEVVVLPAPVIAQPSVIAQAPDVAPAVAPAPAPETLGVTEVQGGAYYYNDRDREVWITLGDRNGLRPTAQVEFLREGEVVGTGTVKNVFTADAVVTPSSTTPAGAIRPGDTVRVVLNGTRAALDKQINQERRLHGVGEILFSVLILWSSF